MTNLSFDNVNHLRSGADYVSLMQSLMTESIDFYQDFLAFILFLLYWEPCGLWQAA